MEVWFRTDLSAYRPSNRTRASGEHYVAYVPDQTSDLNARSVGTPVAQWLARLASVARHRADLRSSNATIDSPS